MPTTDESMATIRAARVFPTTVTIDDTVVVTGSATVTDSAQVRGNSQVAEYAYVSGQCVLTDSRVGEYAQVGGHATIANSSLAGRVIVNHWAHVTGAQLAGTAMVSGWARVGAGEYGLRLNNGTIIGTADIRDARHYVAIGPVGSENRTVTVMRAFHPQHPKQWGALVVAGCFSGTLARLERRLKSDPWGGYSTNQNGRYHADYTSIIALGQQRLQEWRQSEPTEADRAWWLERLGSLGQGQVSNIAAFLSEAMHLDGTTEW